MEIYYSDLKSKIEKKEAKIGIIGMGYVGLPLVIRFCEVGFKVYGFDIDNEKIQKLSLGKSYIKHIEESKIKKILDKFYPTSDFSKLSEVDCIIICVPTPLNKHQEPDMSFVFNTAQTVAKYLKRGHLVILESTVYPGATDEDLRKILETSTLKAGEDFYLAFSPEREDPGNKDFNVSNTPKIVGGFTENCTDLTSSLYSHIVSKVVRVSSTKVAEAAKLLENIYRAINIAFVNELKLLFDRMGIDIWEVIEAAKTKPFGFQAFYPGPGLGGHCIPIDPFYLTWKAKEYDFHTRFIELAGEINNSMPYYVVQKTIEALNSIGKSIKGSKILILGVAYKKDVDDMRESPALKIITLFQEKGAIVDYNDPYVPEIPSLRKYSIKMSSIDLKKEVLSSYDVIVITTDHSLYDPKFILDNSQLIVDTRNLIKLKHPKVVKA